MKDRHIRTNMKVAYDYADNSYCERKRVGCIIVKNGTPIAVGWNGTPPDEDNCCEDEEGNTKPNVAHAEDNALRKLTGSHESAEGASVFVTCAPCIRCAERLVDARVKKVYYAEFYVSTPGLGLSFLEKHGIETELVEL